jgi:hypothetical protein
MKFFLILYLVAVSWGLSAYGKEGMLSPSSVEGMYRVVEITAKDSIYWTLFQKEGEKSPSLAIKTRVQPAGLHSSQTYELRADILRRSATVAEAGQLLVFFPTQQGRTPVCLLSVEQPTANFTGKLTDYDHPGYLTL